MPGGLPGGGMGGFGIDRYIIQTVLEDKDDGVPTIKPYLLSSV